MKRYIALIVFSIICVYAIIFAIYYNIMLGGSDDLMKISEAQTAAARMKNSYKVFLIIDDFGWHSKNAEKYLNLPIDFTIAILPDRPRSQQIYSKALQCKNVSIIIHQPMEAKNNFDIGSSALKIEFNELEIIEVLDNSLKQFPLSIGMNNHAGSLFSEKEEKMKVVLSWIKKNNLLFVDSRTSSQSVVSKVSEELNMDSYSNNLFLDVKNDTEFIDSRLDLMLTLAVKRGSVIAIGHVQSEILFKLLIRRLNEFKLNNIIFCNLKSLRPDIIN